MGSIDALSPAQRAIVIAPPRHLLVIAGPGSGKTRIIVDRIAHLLEREHCAPDQVVALTFTIKAAEELKDRLAAARIVGVAASTFHHFCARLLQDHGAAIGLKPPIRIADEALQEKFVQDAARRAGYDLVRSRYPLTPRGVLDYISRRKRRGLEPGTPLEDQLPDLADALAILDKEYCWLLREAETLDFDDLISRAIELLRGDAETATIVRRRCRLLFIDEFHDVSPEQYALINEIVPPRRRSRRAAHRDEEERSDGAAIMVVADPDQAIFGWRGAEPNKLLPKFQEDYRPTCYTLVENFRSTRNIVRAATHLMSDRGQRQLRSVAEEDGHPIFCLCFLDTAQEAEKLAQLITRAVTEGSYRNFDDVAILYALHDRANDAEHALLRHGIPIRRIRKGRFFDEPDVQEVLRHLDLIAVASDLSFEPALNWPHVVVDELTMIHLRRQARLAGTRLIDFARSLTPESPDVTPLTRVAIHRFLSGVVAKLQPLANGPVDQLVGALLTALECRRSPFAVDDRATVGGFLEFLGSPLQETAFRLREAIACGRPIVLCPFSHSDLDAVAATAILRYTLQEYLGHPVSVAGDRESREEFVVCLGERAGLGDAVCLTERVSGGVRYGLAIQAWRLAQLLLMGYETLDRGRFVILDVETGSLDANRAELIEVAAVRVENGRLSGEEFTSLVRPTHPRALTSDARELTGLTWSHLADAPSAAEVIPELLALLGDDTVVGHNYDGFDGRILARYAREFGYALDNYSLDTLRLAQRLLRGESHYDLQSLSRRFAPRARPVHRALPDAKAAAEVLLGLLDELRRDREVDALPEVLPLVAAGIYASGADDRDENRLLLDAASWVERTGSASQPLVDLRSLAPPEDLDSALHWLRARPRAEEPDQERWERLRAGWQEVLPRFLEASDDASLASFLTYARLATSLDIEQEGDGRVTMMSIHSAKGREWPLVFLIGLEEGVLPSWLARNDEEIAEARRALYVGMTRARRQLILTFAHHSLGWNRERSRFLAELPADLTTWRCYCG